MLYGVDMNCTYCGKQIWSIVGIQFMQGVESPTLLHTVCYERLKDMADIYIKLLEECIFWAVKAIT